MERVERKIDDINDSVPDERYESVAYLQEQLDTDIPDQLWGEPLDGLRLALVPELAPLPTEITLSVGDTLEVELFVENVSEQEIKLGGYINSEVGRRMVMIAPDGQRTEFHARDASPLPIWHTWRLKPGERYMLRMPTINLVGDLPKQTADSTYGFHVKVARGESALGARFQFGRLDNSRHRHVPGESEWIGGLSTGMLTLNVVESGE